MEVKTRLALKYHNGLYLSWGEKNFPLTHKESEARGFFSPEQVTDFLQNSFYRPELYGMDSSDFEVVTIEISYKELSEDGDP